jgi:hypothetical protein
MTEISVCYDVIFFGMAVGHGRLWEFAGCFSPMVENCFQLKSILIGIIVLLVHEVFHNYKLLSMV